MKILMVMETFPALTQTFITNQITSLIDRGHDVDIFALEKGVETIIHPVIERYRLLDRVFYPPQTPQNHLKQHVLVLKLLLTRIRILPLVLLHTLHALRYGAGPFSFRSLLSLPTLMQRSSYHIVHAHFGPMGMLGALLCKTGILSGKLVTTFYGYDVSSFVHYNGVQAYRPLFKEGDLFLALSEAMKNKLIALGCASDKIAVQHLGVAVDAFPFKPRRLKEDGIIRVVTLARFVEKKGLEYGIHAVAKLIGTGRRIRYDLIGDGLLREQISTLIGSLGLGDAIRIHGWKDENQVRRFLDEAHILLAPSVTASNGDQEGTPTVILEAMAAGIPVVSTHHSGIPEQVSDGLTGYLVPERDIDALAQKLGQLADHPDAWAAMGHAGRQRIEEAFNIEKLADQLIVYYRQVLDG